MTTLRRQFHGKPVERLIASVPTTIVNRVRALIARRSHPAQGSISEFIRLAIVEKLHRDSDD